MAILVTGVAGFIGFHVARRLMERGESVVGVDSLNNYYDVPLKRARLDILQSASLFRFRQLDIADREAIRLLLAEHADVDRVIHLAAQAGVRYSLVNPYAYVQSNIEGHVVLLEACRTLSRLEHIVYASSSSVYGANTKLPFAVEDRTDRPVSLYGASKKSMELISHSYASVYRMPLTGLRFFTVYGPWGRPDMAAFIFTRKILAGEPIPVFNHGDMRRDFTYVDDVVEGAVACLDRPPDGRAMAPVYNLGNNRSEALMDFIGTIERELGRKAIVELLPMQKGDVQETYADIEASRRRFGFEPKTSIAEGIPRFLSWYRRHYGV